MHIHLNINCILNLNKYKIDDLWGNSSHSSNTTFEFEVHTETERLPDIITLIKPSLVIAATSEMHGLSRALHKQCFLSFAQNTVTAHDAAVD